MNKYFNTFATVAEYNEYMASEVVNYPNYAYVEATDEVVKVFEEPQPPLAYSLILSTCDPEGDVSNICETQGFCSDSDYYVILLNRGELVNHTDQLVEYYSIAYDETIQPQLVDSYCVWQCSAFDPSIEEIACYDSDMNQIATLLTSCE